MNLIEISIVINVTLQLLITQDWLKDTDKSKLFHWRRL